MRKKRNLLKISRFLKCFAEREGFEPPVPLGTVVFKTTVIDHSTISPVLYLSRKRVQRYVEKMRNRKWEMRNCLCVKDF